MLPKEIGQLTKLKILDLSDCTQLRIISPSLSRLEELYLNQVTVPWNEQSNACLDELKGLSCLTTLAICILDAKIVPKDWFFEKLQRYKILIGGEWDWLDKDEYSKTLKLRVNMSMDHLFKLLLKKAEALYLENLEGVKIVLMQVGHWDCIQHLNHLHVRKASDIQHIMKDTDAIDQISFRELLSMTLENLPQLISFCSSKNRPDVYTST